MKISKKLIWVIAVLIVIVVAVAVYFFSAHSKNSGWESYKGSTSPISFSYPKDWQVTPSQSSDANYKFTLTKSHNKETLVLSLAFGPTGVGGGCPSYDPSKSVVKSDAVKAMGQKAYFIYSGDKAKNITNYAYVSDNAEGKCPNVAFVSIPGKEGLFSANLKGTVQGYPVDISSLKSFNAADFSEIEQIINSTAVTANTPDVATPGTGEQG
jgi:hypothetical protein